jgi:hypothetical protein
MVYLAIDYGTYEGWRLQEYETPELALNAVKSGQFSGSPWKILKELKIAIEDSGE